MLALSCVKMSLLPNSEDVANFNIWPGKEKGKKKRKKEKKEKKEKKKRSFLNQSLHRTMWNIQTNITNILTRVHTSRGHAARQLGQQGTQFHRIVGNVGHMHLIQVHDPLLHGHIVKTTFHEINFSPGFFQPQTFPTDQLVPENQ